MMETILIPPVPGPNIHYFKCDLRSKDDITTKAQEIRERVGEPTILVNNAGVARGKSVLEGNDKDLQLTFGTYFLVCSFPPAPPFLVFAPPP